MRVRIGGMDSDSLSNLSKEELVRRLQQAEQLVSLICLTACSGITVHHELVYTGCLSFFFVVIVTCSSIVDRQSYVCSEYPGVY